MDGASGLTAFASVLTSTVKIAEKVFEITAVDEQAKAVLQTVNQVSSQLQDAKTLRRQKSWILTPFEKRMIDDTFHHTEEAVQQVAKLAERARADMDVSGGKVKIGTRILFVLRDSPNIHVSLTKLGIASQSLNMAMFMLCSREGRQAGVPEPDTTGYYEPEKKGLPTYDESQFLSAGRKKNMERKSAMALHDRYQSVSMTSNNPLPPDNYRSHSDSIIPQHPLPSNGSRTSFVSTGGQYALPPNNFRSHSDSIVPQYPSNSMNMRRASLTPESNRSRTNSISSQTTLAYEENQSPFAPSPWHYDLLTAHISELSSINTLSKFDKTIPDILVEEHSPSVAELDVGAFAAAMSFSPPPTPTQQAQVWTASPERETQDEFQDFSKPTSFMYPSPRQRPTSHSGMESFLAREQSFNCYSDVPYSSPAPAAQQSTSHWDNFTGAQTHDPEHEAFPRFSGSWTEPLPLQRPRSWSERTPSPGPQPTVNAWPQYGNADPHMSGTQQRPPDLDGGGISRVETFPRTYPHAGPLPAPLSPQQPVTGKKRSDRWLEARAQ